MKNPNTLLNCIIQPFQNRMIRGFSFLLIAIGSCFANANTSPNILFITMDDMNWDSVGCYGSTVEEISPHIDSLAERGMRFQHAFIQSPICSPSRNVLQTGCYPHESGVRGFYSVVFPKRTLPELLREVGYFTGIVQKLPDSTPSNDFSKYWDFYKQLPKNVYRTPKAYGANFKKIVDGAKKAGKPFYAVVNVIDPHLPFYRGPKTQKDKEKWDHTPPSRTYEANEVPIPGFLPQDEAFGQEIADYYCTVKRGDDCVGSVLKVLREREMDKDTIIILLSDHGMSVPYAKSCLYPAGVRTPWIVVWPGVSKAGYLDTDHMISAIDFMPSVLEMAGVTIPKSLEGRSIVPLVKGEKQEGRDHVFVELNENPNADVRPARAIYTKDFVYIFNPWSNGEREATMEARWYRSYATFSRLAQNDMAIRERFNFVKYRTVEELYAYSTDPNAFNNLIDNPHYQRVANTLSERLEAWMDRTDDYVLPAFKARENPVALEQFMEDEERKAIERSKDTEWKRWKNRSGETKGHTRLYDPDR